MWPIIEQKILSLSLYLDYFLFCSFWFITDLFQEKLERMSSSKIFIHDFLVPNDGSQGPFEVIFFLRFLSHASSLQCIVNKCSASSCFYSAIELSSRTYSIIGMFVVWCLLSIRTYRLYFQDDDESLFKSARTDYAAVGVILSFDLWPVCFARIPWSMLLFRVDVWRRKQRSTNIPHPTVAIETPTLLSVQVAQLRPMLSMTWQITPHQGDNPLSQCCQWTTMRFDSSHDHGRSLFSLSRKLVLVESLTSHCCQHSVTRYNMNFSWVSSEQRLEEWWRLS